MALASILIDEFVAQDAKEPGALGRLPRKARGGFERGQEGFLDQILGDSRVAHAGGGKTKQRATMLIDPTFRAEPGRGRMWDGSVIRLAC